MKNIFKFGFILLFAMALVFSGVTIAFAQTAGGASVQTNSATSLYSSQATLNGYLAVPYFSASNYVYFQYGTSVNYGSQTAQQYLTSGSFSQVITGLSFNALYHFRAVAQGSFGTIYGPDMTFSTNLSNIDNNNYSSSLVQTNYATYISNLQATLNGTLSSTNLYNSNYLQNYIYFQWGTTTNYGNQTNQQSIGSAGTFNQNISLLNPGTIYHFRAVAQGNYGTVYGQDLTFTTTGTGTGLYNTGNGILSVTKQAIDLTSGNLIWASSVSANPSDILSFAVTLQANSQDVHNVVVRDVLPANLIYKGNLTVNINSNYGGDITSGINIGTVYANQPIVVAYQAQVASAGNFDYGTATMNNNATITSTEAGTQTATANVVVTRTLVQGASTISTGLTNNFLADSFFLPLLVIIASLWLYFSGEAFNLGKKIKSLIKK